METVAGDVLLVDDDELVREAVGRVLDDGGYRVVAVPDLHRAIAWLKVGAFRLIISDLNFPGRVSAESLARKAADCRIPFIVASGAYRLRELCARWTVAEVLAKPFACDELLAAVARSLAPARRPAAQPSSWREPVSAPSAERSSAFEWTPSLA